MAIRVDTAARFLCEEANWSISNLPLQKLLYLAQVDYAAKYDGAELVDGPFQAWDYGPVIPPLYGRLKMFGPDEIDRNVFYNAFRLREGSPSRKVLLGILDTFGSVSPGKLIELTHWARGAWARRYEPGVRGTSITQQDIVREARARENCRREWDRILQRAAA